jgi:protein SPA2
MDDQLPIAADGGLLDIHVTAFLSAIDSLLTAGRSNAPTRVLIPMKSVVNAVSAIVEDVRLFERRPQRERSDVDQDVLRSLRERAEATLSNLVTASKTHATSLGMSPVSLLDAAASHVSATVTDIGRTVCVRKATRAEQDEFAPSATSPPPPNSSATNGFSPSLRSVEEIKHQKKASTASSSSRRADAFGSRFGDSRAAAPPRSLVDDTRRLASEPSSSDTNSPPPIFDQPPSRSAGGLMSDDSANAEGSEDAWAELKVRFLLFLGLTTISHNYIPALPRSAD